MAQHVQASKHLKCHFRSEWPIRPWSTLGWSKVKFGQNHPKITFFMFLHQIRATLWFSSILIKFDPRLTPRGTKNPNFDSTIKTGWDQCHCEDYWIHFPTTIHGLKLKLKWLRYLENHAKHVSSLPGIITFDLTVKISFFYFFILVF